MRSRCVIEKVSQMYRLEQQDVVVRSCPCDMADEAWGVIHFEVSTNYHVEKYGDRTSGSAKGDRPARSPVTSLWCFETMGLFKHAVNSSPLPLLLLLLLRLLWIIKTS